MVYFRKRKPFLIHLVLCLLLIGIFIENQLLIFLSMYQASDSIFAKFLRFFNMSSMIGIYMIIIERIYLLYFQYQYNEATISAKWKEYVNEEHEDFFLSNIHTYGDDKFLFRVTAIIWVIFCCIYIILDYFIPSTSYSSWFIFILFFVLFIFAIYIWRKFPDFHDTLYIRKELQYFVALNFLVLFIWTILLAISDANGKIIIREYLQVIMYSVIFEILIHRVIQWNEIKMDVNNQDDIYVKQMSDRAFGLKQVVESSDGYAQFMKFLVTEFATENLLFVTEYIQLKAILSLSEKEMKSLKLTFDLSLPPDIPIPKIIQDLNLDLEQIKVNQEHRKVKKLKREKEKLQRENENIAKLMQEIKMAKRTKKPTKTEQSLIDEIKQTEIDKYTVSLASPSGHSTHFAYATAVISPNGDTIEEEKDIQIETEPTPTVSPHENTDAATKVTTPTSVNSIDIIREDRAISNSTNKQNKLPPINTEITYVTDNKSDCDDNTTPTVPSTNSNQLHTNYSRESTIGTMIIDNKQNETDLYGIPLKPDEDDVVIIEIDRIKSLETIKTPNQKPLLSEKHTKSLSDVNSIKSMIINQNISDDNVNSENENENEQKKAISLSPKSSEHQSFLQEIMKQKETQKRKQSDPSGYSLNVNENDFSKIPSLSPSPSNSSRYSKDDINVIETIKLKDGKPKKHRHQSLSLRNSGKFGRKNSGEKHRKAESVTSVRLQIVSSRLKSNKKLLSHHLRQTSKKMKSKMSYHMREASQSMALKMNKKNDKFNALNTKSFSILCTKLYYKYIATGVAPLEVNISSATRIRCDSTFRTQQRQRLPNGRHSSFKSGNKRGRTISNGVVSLLSRGNSLKRRNNAMDILRDHGGHIMRSKSKKKLTMMNSEEPFDGDIVRAMSQLLPPLEQCAVELTNLLKDSLSRFKKTQTCAKLYEEYIEMKQTMQVVNEANKKRNSKGTI